MSPRRVVVTGMGAVTPLGVSVDTFWDGLIQGKSGVRRVSAFDTTGFDVRIGAECVDFQADKYIDRKAIKRMDRFTHFALAAAREAITQSGLEVATLDSARAGVVVGSGIGGLMEIEVQKERLIEKGPTKVSAYTIPKLMANAAAGNISIEYGLRGPSTAISTACASATDAMGYALDLVRRGTADVVITGGTEAALTPLGLAAFAAMKALSTRDVPPEQASCPFDAQRDGFVLGEGCGILVFEEVEHARRRGARLLAEVAGYAATSDANHITQPPEDGMGAAAAMAGALHDAGVAPDEVNYINAHGTSTPLGDVAETVALKRVFGEKAKRVAISSTKSSIGHLLGASGGVELVATVNAILCGVVPPTINLHSPDERCDLDFVPNTARDLRVNVAMSNSFGFGGHNACIVLKRLG